MGNDPAGKLNKEKSVIFKTVFLNLNLLLFYLHVFLILRQPGKNATDHSKLWLKKISTSNFTARSPYATNYFHRLQQVQSWFRSFVEN